MAESQKRRYTKGETVVEYRGRRFKTPPPRNIPTIKNATAGDLDALLATAEGAAAADAAELMHYQREQEAWDRGANEALDQYEEDLRARRFQNFMNYGSNWMRSYTRRHTGRKP